MSKPGHNLDDLLLWDLNLDRLCVSHFKKGRYSLSVITALATLAKGIITHGPNDSSLIESEQVINPCRKLFDCGYLFNMDRVIELELSGKLGTLLTEVVRLVGRNLIYSEYKKLTVLRHDKHPASCERNLSNFGSLGQSCHLNQFSRTVRNLINLN